MLDYIRLSLRHAEQLRKRTGPAAFILDPTILLQFECRPPLPNEPPVKLYFLVVSPQRLHEHMFEATFFRMVSNIKVANVVGASGVFQPILLHFPTAKTVAGIPWPETATEIDLTTRLLDINSNWTISFLTHSIGEFLSQRLVIGATELPYAELLANEARARAEAAAAKQKKERTKQKGK